MLMANVPVIVELVAEEGSAPSLIINVTGSVLHGPAVLQSSNDKPQERDMPRKFHEMFMLKVIGQEEGMQPRVNRFLLSLYICVLKNRTDESCFSMPCIAPTLDLLVRNSKACQKGLVSI